MLIEERLSQIIKIVEEKKSVTVLELVQLLDSSESTIRRDLTELDRRGKLSKVHGGATVVEMGYAAIDSELESRYHLYRDEKAAIARYAASLIKAGDFVYIDAGTTTELMIDYITEKNATYVTNAMEHGRKLVNKGFQVYLIGGELKAVTDATVGSEAVEAIKKYNFRKGFWGANGISLKAGYTTPEANEAAVKRKSMEQCTEKYVLGDPSKFNHVSPVTFADFYDVTLITTKIELEVYKKCNNIIEVSEL